MRAYLLIRPLLWTMEAERIHALTLRLLGWGGQLGLLRRLLQRRFVIEDRRLRVQAFGLEFPNPVGLAAGYDKDGQAIQGLAALGFGHLELGTVTRAAQRGNPRPRLFRLAQDQALINRMGFPNQGADHLQRRLAGARPPGIPLGINIGKGIDTPIDEAAEDYLALLRQFHALADYLAVNISSPNTPGLRLLQRREHLEALLCSLVAERDLLGATTGKFTPLLVKLSPDLKAQELEEAVGVIGDQGLDGIIATNTTLARDGLRSEQAAQAGGLSGMPLRQRANAMLEAVQALSGGRLPIIAAGGVDGPDSARQKFDRGAVLVQLYTGLVYRGPGLVRMILEDLLR